MYEEIVNEASQAIVKNDWSTFKRYVTEDFTYKLVGAGMTLSYDEFFTLVETQTILNPEDKHNPYRMIEINDYVITFYENTSVENGKITERMRCHDVIKMEGKRIKSIVVYNSIVPEFKSIGRWLNSLNVEYEGQSI